jgi:nitrate/nitrite-specific signal transduction histidine kinase
MEPFYFITYEYLYFNVIAFSAYIYLAGTYYSSKQKAREIYEQKDQLKIEIEKNRIATEMHDDLGADLSNLLFKLRVYQNSNGNNHLEEYHEIENYTQEIIKKVNETIWTLNSEKDNLISLRNFMLKFLDQFFGKTNVSYQFNNTEALPEKVLLIEKRRNIFHLFKEAIKYIDTFNDLKNVAVELNFEKNNLVIFINYECLGKKIVKNEPQFFLDLIQKRILILNAKYHNEVNESGINKLHFTIDLK